MWHLSIEVDRDSAESLTSQIQRAIRVRISEGALHPGTRLPSTRQLASDLGVSRSVVVESYEQLTAEGFLTSTQGLGTTVASTAAQGGGADATSLLEPEPVDTMRWDLRTGQANATSFPRNEWLACYRKAVADASKVDLGYQPVAGVPQLREVLANYIGRVRGVRTSPHQVMVTAGFAQGLALLCEFLRDLGIRTLAIEDPGHRGQRFFLESSGMRVVPVPVDESGIDVEALRLCGAKAVLTTPSHQFPTGYTLTAERREAMVRWAEERDGLIIEDDYDGELWYDRHSGPPALQSLAPDRVVYAGTASKSLIPSLRIGWLALPSDLVRHVGSVRARHDLGTDSLTQLAFAHMVSSGMLDRHLRRCRSRYRSRREVLAQVVEEALPGTRILGAAAGMHAYLELPATVDEHRLVEQALRRSVRVNGASYHQFATRPRPPALVVGYPTLPLSGLSESIRAIGAALGDLQGGAAVTSRPPIAATPPCSPPTGLSAR